MKSKVLVTVVVLALAVAFLAGCSDKTGDNPTSPAISERVGFGGAIQFFEPIFYSTMNDPGIRPAHIYVPPDYDPNNPSQRYPVLFLVPPFRGNEMYYFEHGLVQVADRLLAEGKIQPMIIVGVDGRSELGGSFLTNSLRQGYFFTALFHDTAYYNVPYGTSSLDIFSKSMLTQIDDNFATLRNREARAIGGIGIGGYGAMKVALETDLFGSVSAVNAALDFDGDDGWRGFWTLIQNTYVPGDWSAVDTSLGNEAMSLIVSAAAAFAPQEQTLSSFWLYNNQFGERTFGYDVGDTLTDDLSSYVAAHRAHVPFTVDGQRNGIIWLEWMSHNIEWIYRNNVDAAHAAYFDQMPKLLIRSDDARFFYDEQMTGFMAFLNSAGIEYESQSFAGNALLSGTAEHFTYDLLEDLLIYHSEHFVVP